MHTDANPQLAFESADSATTAELMSPAVADAVKSRTNFKLLALQFFIGGLVGYLGAKFVLGGIDDLSWASVVWVLAAVVLPFWLCISLQVLLHEAGHVVAGLAVGFKAIAFGVGSRSGPRRSQVTGIAASLRLPRRALRSSQ